MSFRFASLVCTVAALCACGEGAREGLREMPEGWRHLNLTEVGRVEVEPRSDENGLHVHYKDWTRVALLDDVVRSMKAAGYVHTHTMRRWCLLGFERPGEQLALKVDGGDGNLYVDIINGKDPGDRNLMQTTFGDDKSDIVVIKEGSAEAAAAADHIPCVPE